jgi:tRNA(Ile)-lysidine synthase
MAVRASRAGKGSRRIETAVRRAAAGKKIVLAVSGGRDSMALLHAFARAAPESVGAVATFDHGTGSAASTAARFVRSTATELGLQVHLGRATTLGTNEAEWRSARRSFLAEVAHRTGDGGGGSAAVIATAHTLDDQVETVLIRVLRDSGARGLAGLYADSDTLRPLLDFTRAEVAEYARAVGASWMDDPTNDSTQFLRNRVRRDLLPALVAMRPQLPDDLLTLAKAAAKWRRSLDEVTAPTARLRADGSSLAVAAADLAAYSRTELAVLWPALAARVGLAMDWRGTERAAAFTNRSRTGARIQLSGGWEIARSRDEFELRRWRDPGSGEWGQAKGVTAGPGTSEGNR